MRALDITGLRKTYAGGVEALKGVDLAVEEGDFFALLGANGAGKTTLISIATGLTTKTAGSVSVFGVDQDKDPDATRVMIGLVPQEFNFSIFETPRDIIATQGGYYGMPLREAQARADELLEALGLKDKANVQSISLSGGMKRRLLIARALVHRPRLLMLDEPTAGVDVELRRGMWDYLRALNAAGTTIVLTTHYLEEVEQLCKNMVIVQRGSVVKSGPVKALMAEADGRRYRATLSAAPTEAQAAACGAESRDGADIVVSLASGDTLEAFIGRVKAAGLQVVDLNHAHNRLEELYLSTIAK
ncbi:MAG TPA: ABC transporter ATP-binding protein [Candidatus Binatia bacterium]|nr:ABC transporter ATP-binding protein [Candidatus Binatia bacterium]